jgi:hypothetical protein
MPDTPASATYNMPSGPNLSPRGLFKPVAKTLVITCCADFFLEAALVSTSVELPVSFLQAVISTPISKMPVNANVSFLMNVSFCFVEE